MFSYQGSAVWAAKRDSAWLSKSRLKSREENTPPRRQEKASRAQIDPANSSRQVFHGASFIRSELRRAGCGTTPQSAMRVHTIAIACLGAARWHLFGRPCWLAGQRQSAARVDQSGSCELRSWAAALWGLRLGCGVESVSPRLNLSLQSWRIQAALPCFLTCLVQPDESSISSDSTKPVIRKLVERGRVFGPNRRANSAAGLRIARPRQRDEKTAQRSQVAPGEQCQVRLQPPQQAAKQPTPGFTVHQPRLALAIKNVSKR
ncbi:hypothetical protein BJY00DRAFT_173735 [Aspergillus carlsbadensis]|nr:hypothetical protein BJY00DRAFT_173735 [Aspergillus carlsbadensis]